MINANLSGASRALFLTLRARADEHKRSDRLFDDQWSEDWHPHAPRYDDYETWYNPTFQTMCAIRTRLIDDVVTDFLAQHDSALVIELGAGFSTRYYRVGQPSHRWIDLDLPEVVATRRKIDVEVTEHWFLGADVSTEEWLAELPKFSEENILLIAEGLLMFLSAEAVAKTFQLLTDHFAGATFVFDVVNKGFFDYVNDSYRAIHMPMRWSVHERELTTYGLNVANIHYLTSQYPKRWDEAGLHAYERAEDLSGYVVVATIK